MIELCGHDLDVAARAIAREQREQCHGVHTARDGEQDAAARGRREVALPVTAERGGQCGGQREKVVIESNGGGGRI